MASEAEEVPEELSSLFERLFRQRDSRLFLPIILGFTNLSTRETSPTQENPDQETPQTTTSSTTPHERIILVNPLTQGMVVIEGGASNLEALFRDLANKVGQPPASKASIEAMPSVEIDEGEDQEGECVVCLEEWEVGGVVKVMPCNHKFHPDCIEKWLEIHGSCPVCRYKMPVEEEEMGKKLDEEEGGEGIGERVRRMQREIWVSFFFNGSRQNPNEVPAPVSGSRDVDVDVDPSSGASSNETES